MELDDLVDAVGEVLARQGWDLSEDNAAGLVRAALEAQRALGARDEPTRPLPS